MLGIYGDYEIKKATQDEVYILSLKVCDMEVLELWQLFHIDIETMLTILFEDEKQEIYSLYFQGDIIGMGGLAPLNGLGLHCAEIWFLGENLINHQRFLVQYGKQIIQKSLEKFPILLNQTAAWNKKTLRMVKYLGFTIDEKYLRLGCEKILFKRFYVTK